MTSGYTALESPVSLGKALRVAPGRKGKPAAQFWKFWVSGNEVYATSRLLGNAAKISVHASGQIHIRLEQRDLRQLAPPLLLGDGQWLHAFELRFLLSPDTCAPPPEKLKERAFLIEVPPDTVLILNLLVGQLGGSREAALPRELLPAGKPLWRATLRDQRPVVLAARILEMDQKNKDEIAFIRTELNPKVNMSKRPTSPPYVEIRRVVWDTTGGNVVLVVPMGQEAFRVHEEPATASIAAPVADSRRILVSTPSMSLEIAAPNGAIVGTLLFAGVTGEITLTKNVTNRSPLATVVLAMNPSNLIFGNSFATSRMVCPAAPTIDGGQPRNWEYSVFCQFDGTVLKAEVRQVSSALRNANIPVPMPHVADTEELLLVAPAKALVLCVTADAPQCSLDLEATLLLRDI